MRLCKEVTDGGRFFFADASGGAALGATLQPDCILKGKLSCAINANGSFSTSEFRLKRQSKNAIMSALRDSGFE